MKNPKQITAFRLFRDCLGGGGWTNTVYTDKATAGMVAEENREEFVNFKVHEVKVRILTEDEGAVGNDLVKIDRTAANAKLRERALKKLTPAERKALLGD